MSTEASGMLVKTLVEKPTSTENTAKNGDEQIQGMSLTVSIESPKLADPAILVVREIAKIRYTREELLKLRDVPLSKVKPDFLYISECAPSILHSTDPSSENGPRSGEPAEHRRRPGDPRERIRKENDGIVLSPQRRSFNSGCFVPVREPTRTNRSHSPLSKNEGGSHPTVREIQPGNRRIGSGRILRDTWDFSEKAEGDGEYTFRGPRGGERDEKFPDRRSFGREFEINREKEKDRRNSRYNDRRRISNNCDEEPEWFSGGPVSQNDTIELRGFDEPEKPGKKKLSPSKVKRAQEWANKKKETQSSLDEKEENKNPSEIEGSNCQFMGDGNNEGTNNNNIADDNKGSGDSDERPVQTLDDHAFNFDDFLKCDTIPGLLTNGVGGDGDNAKSRFSAWFKRESPDKLMSESRRSSFQDDHLIKNLLTDITEPSVSIPSDSDTYFAPISPAANTGNDLGGNMGPQAGSKVVNIMEMLQRNKLQSQNPLVADVPPAMKRSQLPGKMVSLDEIESRIRQGNEEHTIKQSQTKRDDDLTAFNRLLAQVNGGHAVTANGPMPAQNTSMTLLEMLSHSQQQDEARMASAAHLLGGPASPNTSSLLQQVQNQVHQRQQQIDMMNKFINMGNVNMHPQQQLRASPLQDMGIQQSRELLMRPEAQAILQGLNRGDITPQHIYQQLANPALQPRHRDMLHAIIKLQSQKSGVGPSPRVLSPVPPPHHMYSQQQQLRVSPHPQNSMHQRIPSPRELQVHTQNILQRALIKKKLEEQQENYRKKQEMQQRGQSPNNNNNNTQPIKSQPSPTPLAFTPTSVLRKMTADKDDSKDGNKSILDKAPQGRAVTGMRQATTGPPQPQWNSQFPLKQPVGRPIVKASSNFQPTSQAEQFFTPQQQRLLNQQQQQVQRKGVQPPQQQQPPSYHPGAQNHMSHIPYQSNSNQQFSQQLTQQQLRAQHQQHARPSNAPPQPPQPVHHNMHPHNYHPVNQQPAQQQQQQQQPNWQQYLNTQNSRVNQIGRGGINDGDLSPTTNQLARWFSPDLLERARVGELPSTAGLAQRVMSLEEIERQTAPPVHN